MDEPTKTEPIGLAVDRDRLLGRVRVLSHDDDYLDRDWSERRVLRRSDGALETI